LDKKLVRLKSGRRAAFVALLSKEDSFEEPSRVVADLKSMLAGAGLDFFYNFDDRPVCCDDLGPAFQPAGCHGQETESSLPDALHPVKTRYRRQNRESMV